MSKTAGVTEQSVSALGRQCAVGCFVLSLWSLHVRVGRPEWAAFSGQARILWTPSSIDSQFRVQDGIVFEFNLHTCSHRLSVISRSLITSNTR